MSGLAHYLEDEGIATTLVSLVATQSRKVNPPRVLWVPFELGRPLGEPELPAFQRDVLSAALALLDEPGGPVRRDYGADAPGAADVAGWQGPALASAGSIAEEVAMLEPLFAAFESRAGRSSFGVSGLSPRAAACYVTDYPAIPASAPVAGVSDLVRLRFAADDLKAFYFASAMGAKSRPSSGQLGQWLWHSTRLGARLRALRTAALASDDKKFATVAGRFLVPRDWA